MGISPHLDYSLSEAAGAASAGAGAAVSSFFLVAFFFLPPDFLALAAAMAVALKASLIRADLPDL